MTVINITTLKNKATETGCKIAENISMKNYTTFHTGGNCPLLIEPVSVEAIIKIIEECNKSEIPLTVLGNGSNVLVSDEGINGVVLHIADTLNKIELIAENTIFCEAGLKLGTLCNFAADNELTGLEFAFGIPGTVGGAVFMNAGAYGGEIKDVLIETKVMDRDGNIFVLNNEEQKFSYRKSLFMEKDYIYIKVSNKNFKYDY